MRHRHGKTGPRPVSCWWDLNPRPRPYQGRTLPTELQQRGTHPSLGDRHPGDTPIPFSGRPSGNAPERVKGIEPSPPAWKAGALPLSYTRLPGARNQDSEITITGHSLPESWFLNPDSSPVGAVGFEPTKAEPPDLQSGPFGHSGTPPDLAPPDPGHLATDRRNAGTTDGEILHDHFHAPRQHEKSSMMS
jgi:hypothetical protein